MHRGAWQATVPGVTQSWTQMKQFNTHSNIRLTCSSLHGHFMLLCVYTHTHTHTYEKGMTTYSHILAWRIPWTGKPGRLQSMESQRV